MHGGIKETERQIHQRINSGESVGIKGRREADAVGEGSILKVGGRSPRGQMSQGGVLICRLEGEAGKGRGWPRFPVVQKGLGALSEDEVDSYAKSTQPASFVSLNFYLIFVPSLVWPQSSNSFFPDPFSSC